MDGEKKLSETVLLKVFKWLDLKDLMTCSHVCRTWNKISNDVSLWTQVNLSNFRRFLNEKRICNFLSARGSPKLESLNLSHLSITPKVLSAVKSSCPNLKYLNLQQCCFDRFPKDTKFDDVPEKLELLNLRHTHDHPVLQSISNKLQSINYLAITDSFLVNIAEWEFFRKARNLLVLDISHSSTAEDDIFVHIARTCSQLQSLSIRHCCNIYGEELHEVFEKCKKLRSLFIVGTNIDDQALQYCDLSKCRLDELEISWCKKVKGSGLKTLLSKRSSLSYLRLCSNMCGSAVDSDVIRAMYFRHPKLKVLDISYATKIKNDDVSKLIETLPNAEYLRVSCCRNLDSDLLNFIPKRVKVNATFNSPPQEFFTAPTHDEIFRTIASNSFIASPYPEVSSTESLKERSFEKMITRFCKR